MSRRVVSTMVLHWPTDTRDCIILVLLFIVVKYIAATHSRAQQGHLFDVYLTRASTDSLNPAFIGPGAYMRIMRKTRGSPPAIYGFYPIIQDVPVNTNATWMSYQKFNNQWKESFIKGSMPLCDVLGSKIQLYRIFYNTSNFPYKCPVKRGNYTFDGFYFDSKKLPPLIPGNEWRIRTGWYLGNTAILNFSFDCKIDRSKEIRAKKEHHQ